MADDNWLLPRVYALVAELEALKIEVVVMQVENTERTNSGQAVAHGPNQFAYIKDQMYSIGQQLESLWRN